MKPWLWLSLCALVSWGLWGFFGKLGSRTLSSENMVIHALMGNLLVLPLYLVIYRNAFRFRPDNLDHVFAVLGGVAGSVGTIFFLYGLARGDASRVVTITALYPVVTIILASLFLNEPFSVQRMFGFLFALAGIVLLSK